MNLGKRVIYLNLIIFLIGCSKANRKSDLALMEINGKVRTIKESTYGCEQITGNCETEIKLLEEIYEFNEIGNQVRDITNNLVQSETKVTEITFDKENRPLKQDITITVGGSNYKQELTYEWPTNYEMKHSMIINGVVTGYTIEKYDKKFNLLSRKQYSMDNGREKLIYEETNTIDDKGTWTNNSTKEIGKEEFKMTREYDSKKRLIKTLNYYAGNLTSTRNISYNENDDIVKDEYIMHNNLPGEVYEFEYEYDDKRNWIKKKSIVGGKPLAITKREITYY